MCCSLLTATLKESRSGKHATVSGRVYHWTMDSGFPTRSDTNRAVQPQEMDRALKLQIQEVEELYYPSSENKGADQLRGYREADLRLCFRIYKMPVFS